MNSHPYLLEFSVRKNDDGTATPCMTIRTRDGSIKFEPVNGHFSNAVSADGIIYQIITLVQNSMFLAPEQFGS